MCVETNLPDALLSKPYTVKLKFEVSHCVCSRVEIKVKMGGGGAWLQVGWEVGGGPTTTTYLRASFLLECSMMTSSMLFECRPLPDSTLHLPDIIHVISVPRPVFSTHPRA